MSDVAMTVRLADPALLVLIQQRIIEAIEDLGVGAERYKDALLSRAAQIMFNSVRRKREERIVDEIGKSAPALAYPVKARAFQEWLRSYGVTGAQTADVIIKCPELLNNKTESLQAKFAANLEWLALYGVTDQQLAVACLKSPSLFYMDPQTLKDKFSGNLQWLSPHRVTAQQWAITVIKNPQLSYLDPERLRSNFETVLDRMKAHGVIEVDLSKAFLKQPALFWQNPDKTINNFELLLIISEMPSFLPANHKADFHKTRVSRIISRPDFLCLSEDNLLLRLTFAELGIRKASSAPIRESRATIEKEIVARLICGHVEMTRKGCVDKVAKIAPDTVLQKELSAYARCIREGWRSQPVANVSRTPVQPILPLLAPVKSATGTCDPTVLLHRMVQGGLIKGLHLSPG